MVTSYISFTLTAVNCLLIVNVFSGITVIQLYLQSSNQFVLFQCKYINLILVTSENQSQKLVIQACEKYYFLFDNVNQINQKVIITVANIHVLFTCTATSC